MRTSLFCIVLVSLIDCFSIGFLFSPLQHLQQRLLGPLHFLSDSALKETNNNDGGNEDREPLKSFSSVPQYDPSDKLELRQDKMNVGNPQIMVYEENDMTVTDILRELAAIRQEGPQKYCILGTRHCSYLHQQIIELLAYALVLSGNHVYTSGAQGTNAAAVRGALRANQTDLLTVVLPQSFAKQTSESQELLSKVQNIIDFPERDDLSLEMASRLCNSFMLNRTDQLISFAFHESTTVIEAVDEAKEKKKLVTMLFLD